MTQDRFVWLSFTLLWFGPVYVFREIWGDCLMQPLCSSPAVFKINSLTSAKILNGSFTNSASPIHSLALLSDTNVCVSGHRAD